MEAGWSAALLSDPCPLWFRAGWSDSRQRKAKPSSSIASDDQRDLDHRSTCQSQSGRPSARLRGGTSGARWAALFDNSYPASGVPSRAEFPNQIWAHGKDGLFVSVDRGANWTEVWGTARVRRCRSSLLTASGYMVADGGGYHHCQREQPFRASSSQDRGGLV